MHVIFTCYLMNQTESRRGYVIFTLKKNLGEDKESTLFRFMRMKSVNPVGHRPHTMN